MVVVRERWRRLRRHKWLSLLIDVVLIMVVLGAVHSWQTRNLPVDEPAPETRLALLDGSGIASAAQGGETGIVYFFAPWCFYCKASISNLNSLVAEGSVAWGAVVALDYGSVEEVQAFIDETGVSLPVLMGTAQTAVDWSIRGFPTYFVVDGEGRITSRSVGYSTWLGMRLRAL